jgi:hypothetical protein
VAKGGPPVSDNTEADAVALALALALVLALALALGATEEAALMGTAVEPALADALGDADVCCARATDENSIAPSMQSPINNNTFLTVPPPVACPGAG